MSKRSSEFSHHTLRTPDEFTQDIFDATHQELEIDLEDERVLREIALFAERCDVSEELTRLRSHQELLKNIFQEDGSVGRKLEFALQEVSRELNTVASKSPSVEVKRLVIDSRAEVEKMREQVLNVE